VRLPENSFRGTAGASSGGTNYPRYSTPELDILLDRYLATIPQAERTRVAGQVVNHLTANVVQMGLYYDAEPSLVSHRLKNFNGYVWKAHEWELTS
jgi:ABC-type transport system substrate-binding protein